MSTVYCPFCDSPITDAHFKAGVVADNEIYKCGELSSIELAHTACVVLQSGWRPGKATDFKGEKR